MRNSTRAAIKVINTVLLRIVRKADDILPKLSIAIAGFGLCLMLLLVGSQLITRNLLHGALPFAEEYVAYLIPVVGIVGAAYTLKKGGHVRVDHFLRFMPENARQWLIIAGYVQGLVFLTFMGVQTFNLAMTSLRKGYVAITAMETPLAYPQLLLPFGLWLFALQLLIEIIIATRTLIQSNNRSDSLSGQ